MKRLIDAIIAKWFCLHDWDEVGGRIKVWGYEKSDMPIGFEQTYCCKKCGKFKKVKQ